VLLALTARLSVIKLGGSAITVKSKPLAPRLSVIKAVAEDLACLYEEGERFIVIHGGGSYGHPLASKYCLHKGFTNVVQLKGFAETELAMRDINSILVSSLAEAGVPVAPMHPSCMAVACRGEIADLYLKPLKLTLELGLIPLLHGDVVMDVKDGFTVISGDKLATFLALRFKAKKVVFGMDVKGLFDKDPKVHPDAKLLKLVKARELGNISSVPSVRWDVTGGMRAKLAEARKVASKGIVVCMGSIVEKGGLLKMVKGIEGDYTVIVP